MQKPPEKYSTDQRKRPKIGLLLNLLIYHYTQGLFQGAMERAIHHDANLLCFAGGLLQHQDPFWAQGAIVYDLARADNIDGLIIVSSIIGSQIDRAGIITFCEAYRPLPLVSLGLNLPDIPSVVTDNYQGMYAVIEHLIVGHGARRIAFIQGQETNQEAQERYRAYCDVLAAHGIPLDPTLVLPGNLLYYGGQAAIRMLLDERGCQVGENPDAIAAANDYMAIGALEALQQRGIVVPHDVVIAGFDDVSRTRACTPPLTTTRQPLYEMGAQAVELLLACLRNEPIPERVTIPPDLIIRQSCGCQSLAVLRVVTDQCQTPSEVGLSGRRDTIVAEMACAGECPETAVPWAAQLYDAFIAELNEPGSGIFLKHLEQVLLQVAETGEEVSTWHNPLSVLRRRTLPDVPAGALFRIEECWQQARIVVGEVAERVQALRGVQTWLQSYRWRTTRPVLFSASRTEELMDILTERLPHVGVRGCYLALYESPQPYTYPQPAPEWSHLILAYNQQGRRHIGAAGQRFRTRHVAPADILDQDRPYRLIVTPLYFLDTQLGFVVFEHFARDPSIYETLRVDICTALREVLLSEQNLEYQEHLETLVQELKQTLEHLQRTQAQLIESEKMAALGKLIANIAHELNTPLGAIQASYGNVDRAFDESMQAFPQLLEILSADLRQLFFALIAQALHDKQILTSREERQLRRQLQLALTAHAIEQADPLADMLVDMGIYKDIEGYLPIFRHEYAALMLQIAYNLSIQHHHNTNIGMAVSRMSNVVRALKHYAHHDLSGKKIRADIVEGLEVALTLYHNQIKNGIEVVKQYDDVPAILCYPDELQHVWTNLIHNAIWAMQGKGRLEITVGARQESETSDQLSEPRTLYLVVSITDSGCGISDDIKDRIFEPFFTTKAAGEGSGLGLDICKKIIDKHQGRIEVASLPGKTTFSAWLPVSLKTSEV